MLRAPDAKAVGGSLCFCYYEAESVLADCCFDAIVRLKAMFCRYCSVVSA